MRTTVLIPVKRFADAKQRLGPALGPNERAALAQRMATQVVSACYPLDVVVVCDDEAVRSWARGQDVEALWTPNRGLNGAVADGVQTLAGRGVSHVVVTHADLPIVSQGCFERLDPWPGVTLVPDRRGRGTNVIAIDPRVGFRFSFGANSFFRHCVEATRLRRGLRIVRDHELGWDLDYPEDLVALQHAESYGGEVRCALA